MASLLHVPVASILIDNLQSCVLGKLITKFDVDCRADALTGFQTTVMYM